MFAFFLVTVCSLFLTTSGSVAKHHSPAVVREPVNNNNVQSSQTVFITNEGSDGGFGGYGGYGGLGGLGGAVYSDELSGGVFVEQGVDSGAGGGGVGLGNAGYGSGSSHSEGFHGEGVGVLGESAGESTGAVLTSLAQSSANIASDVVKTQLLAGSEADYKVKLNYATTAIGAAQTAKVAVVGKKAIIQTIEIQAVDTKRQLLAEYNQLRKLKALYVLTQRVNEEAQSHLNTLTAAVSVAQSVASRTQQTSAEAASIATAQQALVADLKRKLSLINNQLNQANADLKATEISALNAFRSAENAQKVASDAGQVVALANSRSNQIAAGEYRHGGPGGPPSPVFPGGQGWPVGPGFPEGPGGPGGPIIVEPYYGGDNHHEDGGDGWGNNHH